MCTWTTEDCQLHRLTDASSKHALAQRQEQTQQNARECRPLTDALVQVLHKTPLVQRNVDINVCTGVCA